MAEEVFVSRVENQTRSMLMVWISLLWISDLPDILLYYLIGPIPTWLIYIKFGVMLLYTAFCLVSRRFNILPYAFFMLMLIGWVMASDWIQIQHWWSAWMPLTESSLFWGYTKIFVRDIALVFLIIAVMWLLKQKRTPVYLRVVIGKPRQNW